MMLVGFTALSVESMTAEVIYVNGSAASSKLRVPKVVGDHLGRLSSEAHVCAPRHERYGSTTPEPTESGQ